MKRLSLLFILIFTLALLAGCSSPKDRFVDAAARSGTLTTDRKVLECAADKLQEKLSEGEFSRLVEDLEKIADKEMQASEAGMKGMSAMTVATGACATGSLIDGLMGGGQNN